MIQDETRLEKTRLSRAYRARLSHALQHLLMWLKATNFDEGPWVFNAASANQALAGYLQWCHAVGVSFSLAQHALLAFQTRHSHLRGHLGRAWDSIKAWKQQLPQRHRLPMPIVVLKALFATLLDFAVRAPSGSIWVTIAVLTRLGFYALLRPGELLALRRGDIKFMNRDDDSVILIIGIKDPKNRNAMGRTQFATISDQPTVLWAHWLFNHLSPLTRLWPSTKERFVQVFRTGLKQCGAASMQLTLGSLRPGGTTHMYLHGTEVPRIKLAGRWANENSLTHYIQEAMSFMVWGSLSPEHEAQVRYIAEASNFAWIRPPVPSSASALFTSWQRSPRRKSKVHSSPSKKTR